VFHRIHAARSSISHHVCALRSLERPVGIAAFIWLGGLQFEASDIMPGSRGDVHELVVTAWAGQ